MWPVSTFSFQDEVITKSQLPLMLADYDSYISNFKQERESLRSLDPQQKL